MSKIVVPDYSEKTFTLIMKHVLNERARTVRERYDALNARSDAPSVEDYCRHDHEYEKLDQRVFVFDKIAVLCENWEHDYRELAHIVRDVKHLPEHVLEKLECQQ